MLSLFATAFSPPEAAPAGTWKVLDKAFSAISIGIAFTDASTGYTSHTDGASAPKIVKTTNGGLNWTAVETTKNVVLPMGFATSHSGAVKHVGTVGLLADTYSTDGTTFKSSVSPVLTSQSIKYEGGRFSAAGPNGACHSLDGALFTCASKAPLKVKGTGRYVSSPTKDVIYLTAGRWPSAPPPPSAPASGSDLELSRHVRVRHAAGGLSARFAPRAADELAANNSYSAEIVKSEDGGKTWSSLLFDEGAFYFNDIDCFNATLCVAVGEGFAQDGSTSPGARVYVTTDGKNFTLAHQGEDGSSLMAVKALSATEHWAGGASKSGALAAPVLALHSTDGGKTWANDPSCDKVRGQMITAMDFVGGVGYATTVNALQVSSLLKYA
jgi:photosystem II stability/assembly factor-like uncharacterized protein